MKRYLLSALFLLVACGERTSIQTGEVGKILDNDGLEKGVRGPGTFRMDWCGTTACPKLVRLEVNKYTTDLKIDSLFLPKSNVDIKDVQIGIQFQVKNDRKSIEQIFREVRPVAARDDADGSNRVLVISAEMVYDTYLKRKAPDAIITALRAHTVDEILTTVPEIAEEAKNAANAMLSEAPVEITELGFPNGIGEPPAEVLDAKRKLYAIDEERARALRALEADLVIEDQRQAVQRKRVANDAANAKAAGVPYDVYVKLKNQERYMDAQDAMAAAIAQSPSAVLFQPAPLPQ